VNHSDELDGILAELTSTREEYERRTDRALNDKQAAETLAMLVAGEIRCALMAASITSLTDNLPATLLPLLVAHGMWTREHAVAHASRLSVLDSRAAALSQTGPILEHLASPAGQENEQAVPCAKRHIGLPGP
jgi:hypothetical protein